MLRNNFPSGICNCWGVPSGAEAVISNLKFGDAVFLIEHVSGDGNIPILCEVKVYIERKLPGLSEVLWGDSRFPFIFFFNTEVLDLTWAEFIKYVGYSANYNPRGQFLGLDSERIAHFENEPDFLEYIRQNHSQGYYLSNPRKGMIPEPIDEFLNTEDDAAYSEGKLVVRTRQERIRNRRLVAKAKDQFRSEHGKLFCIVCGFCFADFYGEDLGGNFIEAHHRNPISDILTSEEQLSSTDDLDMVCPNCHRMIHSQTPPLTVDELREIIDSNRR